MSASLTDIECIVCSLIGGLIISAPPRQFTLRRQKIRSKPLQLHTLCYYKNPDMKLYVLQYQDPQPTLTTKIQNHPGSQWGLFRACQGNSRIDRSDYYSSESELSVRNRKEAVAYRDQGLYRGLMRLDTAGVTEKWTGTCPTTNSGDRCLLQAEAAEE